MSWEEKPGDAASQRVERVLRHPDGSPDIAAYSRIAHRERDAAILSATREAARRLRATWSYFWAGRGALGRMRPSEVKPPRSGSDRP